jgi:hypothetical protein
MVAFSCHVRIAARDLQSINFRIMGAGLLHNDRSTPPIFIPLKIHSPASLRYNPNIIKNPKMSANL